MKLRAEKRLDKYVSPQAIRDWIDVCRDLGYLAPTTQGKRNPERGPNLPDNKEDNHG
jgi:hypothetical protein